VSATQSRIVVLALDNAGTVELAVVNISGGNNLTETGLISTTAEGGAGAADSASVIYSNVARTSVAYRVVGYVESTQATAGTWATAPSTIQGCGGQALTAMSSLGYSQTYTASGKSAATTYYNTTGRPIFILLVADGSTSTMSLLINGTERGYSFVAASANIPMSAIIPPGATYRVDMGGSGAIRTWSELS
jgi:hypothetical protein